MSFTPRTDAELLGQIKALLSEGAAPSPATVARKLNIGWKAAERLLAKVDRDDIGAAVTDHENRGRRIEQIASSIIASITHATYGRRVPVDAVIETERLRLRNWTISDADAFDRHCNTEAVMRQLGGIQSRAELLDDVQYFIDSEADDGITFWVMERKSDDAFLGFCGLVYVIDEGIPVFDDVEIGWRVRQDVWRQGYAEEAARAVLNYVFDELNLKRVVSRSNEDNNASQNLMKKLGMRRRRDFDHRVAGVGYALVVHVIGPTAWEHNAI